MSILVGFNQKQDKALSALENVKFEFLSSVIDTITNIEKIIDERERELELREARALPFKTYKTKEAAALLNISAQSLTILVYQNEIQCAKIGKSYVFREAALIELQIRAERGEVTLNTKEGNNA